MVAVLPVCKACRENICCFVMERWKPFQLVFAKIESSTHGLALLRPLHIKQLFDWNPWTTCLDHVDSRKQNARISGTHYSSW